MREERERAREAAVKERREALLGAFAPAAGRCLFSVTFTGFEWDSLTACRPSCGALEALYVAEGHLDIPGGQKGLKRFERDVVFALALLAAGDGSSSLTFVGGRQIVHLRRSHPAPKKARRPDPTPDAALLVAHRPRANGDGRHAHVSSPTAASSPKSAATDEWINTQESLSL